MSASDPSWVWPFWLERQLDPASPDFVPGTAGADLVNLTHRNVTMVGNLATPERAAWAHGGWRGAP